MVPFCVLLVSLTIMIVELFFCHMITGFGDPSTAHTYVMLPSFRDTETLLG